MSAFSTNQVRQLYVVDSYKATPVGVSDPIGTISVESNADGDLYFMYKGADTPMRSDLINKSKITYAKTTPVSKLAQNLKRYEVVLDPTINSGNPVAGQDYILRITFFEYIGLSYEDQYFKFGEVYALTGMTPSQFYYKMMDSIQANFAKEIVPSLNFGLKGVLGGLTLVSSQPAYTYVINAASATASATLINNVVTLVPLTGGTIADLNAAITAANIPGLYVDSIGTLSTVSTATAITATSLVIEEVAQPWVLGKMEGAALQFKIQSLPITFSGDTLIWAVVNTLTPNNTIPEGLVIADLEYFCMGERGDIYRGMGYPDNIVTKYLVDPTLTYNTIDISFYTTEDADTQKSNKQITLVVPNVGATLANQVALTNTVIAAINSAGGTSIAALPTA